MRDHVPHERLSVADVPAADAPWEEIAEFGHTFHAYKVAGSVPRVRDLALEDHERFASDGSLPSDLTRLRLDLFATVRAVGLDGRPDPDMERWARALVGAVTEQLAGDADA